MTATLEIPKKKPGRKPAKEWKPPFDNWSKTDVKNFFNQKDYKLVNYWIKNGYLKEQWLPGKEYPVFLKEDVLALRQNQPYPKSKKS